MSYKRLIELEAQHKQEVRDLFELGERADQGEIYVPEGLVVEKEITIRQERLLNLAKAHYAAEQNRPSMKPKWLNVRKKRADIATNRKDARHNYRKTVALAKAISTNSLIPKHA